MLRDKLVQLIIILDVVSWRQWKDDLGEEGYTVVRQKMIDDLVACICVFVEMDTWMEVNEQHVPQSAEKLIKPTQEPALNLEGEFGFSLSALSFERDCPLYEIIWSILIPPLFQISNTISSEDSTNCCIVPLFNHYVHLRLTQQPRHILYG